MRLANKFGFTLKEYVSAVNKRPEAKSVLNYCPDDRYLHLNVTKWGNFGKKTCFLDDIMKIEKKKLGPSHYKSALVGPDWLCLLKCSAYVKSATELQTGFWP